MKYDKDLIETMYLLQQSNPALAERMWNRLVIVEKEQSNVPSIRKINLGYGLEVTQEVFNYIQRNHTAANKVAAIKAMREKTGWGLKEAKDAVDRMIAEGWLRY